MGLAKYYQLMSWFSNKKATRNASSSRSSLPLNAPSFPLLAIPLPPTPAMISDDYVPLAHTASISSVSVVTTPSPVLLTETEVESFDMSTLRNHLPINAYFASPSKSSDGECLSSKFSASPVSYCASRSSLGSPASCITSTSFSSYDSLDLDRRYPYKPAHLANWQWNKRSEEINLKLANKLQVTAEPPTEYTPLPATINPKMCVKHTSQLSLMGKVWHQRLCHIGDKNISNMVEYTREYSYIEHYGQHSCSLCSFVSDALLYTEPNVFLQAKSPLELVHVELGCVAMNVSSTTGQYYFYLLFVDDSSHYSSVFSLGSCPTEVDVAAKFQLFIESNQNTQSRRILKIRTYASLSKFAPQIKSLLVLNEIDHEHLSSGSSIAQRSNKILRLVTRVMLTQSALPDQFFPRALRYTVHTLNRVYDNALEGMHQSSSKSPYEQFFGPGRVPDLRYLRSFGCQCLVYNRLNNKSECGIFLGYQARHHKRCKPSILHDYQVWCNGQIWTVSHDVKFNEQCFPASPNQPDGGAQMVVADWIEPISPHKKSIKMVYQMYDQLDSADDAQRTAVNCDRAESRNNAFGSLYEATNFKSIQTAPTLPETPYLLNQQDRTNVNRTELAHLIEMYQTLNNYATRKVEQYTEQLRTLDQIKEEEEEEENDEGNSEQDEDAEGDWDSFMRKL